MEYGKKEGNDKIGVFITEHHKRNGKIKQPNFPTCHQSSQITFPFGHLLAMIDPVNFLLLKLERHISF